MIEMNTLYSLFDFTTTKDRRIEVELCRIHAEKTPE
jgi:hypothetical protein